MGIHAAADTEYDWAFYGGLVGAYFDSHPAIQPATVGSRTTPTRRPRIWATAWNRTDEWYNYRTNPRRPVHVLASLDESSYTGGTMNGDHPIAWCQNYAGRPLLLHRRRPHQGVRYAEPAFRQHLLGGIRWATGTGPGRLPPGERLPAALRRHDSLEGWKQAGPGTFTVSDDGTLTSSGGMGLLWYADQELRRRTR